MIELRCLGSIDLRSPERGPATRVIAQPKRYAVLAYLVLANPRGFHRRDTLIALFWPESDDEHASKISTSRAFSERWGIKAPMKAPTSV